MNLLTGVMRRFNRLATSWCAALAVAVIAMIGVPEAGLAGTVTVIETAPNITGEVIFDNGRLPLPIGGGYAQAPIPMPPFGSPYFTPDGNFSVFGDLSAVNIGGVSIAIVLDLTVTNVTGVRGVST